MYLIAEIGVNFYDVAKKYNISPMDACKLMIVEAKNSGAHCVKFQSYKADTLTVKDAPSPNIINAKAIGAIVVTIPIIFK